MKLPSSSPSLDLSSTDATAGCLSSVLRRLLCGSIRRSSGRDADEVGTTQEWNPAEKQKPPAPGIVARLMGLDSMPVFPYTPPTDSIGRSRSTNSIESWSGFVTHKRTSSDPQMRATLSFREVPTYLRQENEDFLLLSFTPDHGGRTISSNGVKPKMGIGELKPAKAKAKAEGATKKKNERRTAEKKAKQRICREKALEAKDSIPSKKGAHRKPRRAVTKPEKHREMPERSIATRKKLAYANRKVELECSSQNSSPVSVLDHSLDIDIECFSLSPESPISEEDRKPKQRNSRRKLSSDLADRRDASLSVSRDGGMSLHEHEVNRSRKPEQGLHDFSETWGLICSMAEEEMKTSNWVSREIHKLEDVGELAAQIGLEMFDLLLGEVVAELSHCTIIV